jgi:hypothetical protein
LHVASCRSRYEKAPRLEALSESLEEWAARSHLDAVAPLSDAELDAAMAQLERDGFCVLPARLPAAAAAELAERCWALHQEQGSVEAVSTVHKQSSFLEQSSVRMSWIKCSDRLLVIATADARAAESRPS